MAYIDFSQRVLKHGGTIWYVRKDGSDAKCLDLMQSLVSIILLRLRGLVLVQQVKFIGIVSGNRLPKMDL